MKTNFYIDGFNLYYGCLKGTPYRWLDLSALCGRLLRDDSEVVAIKYFTAKVSPRAGNPHHAQRQQAYIRALETIAVLSVRYGHFITRPAMRKLVNPPRRGPPLRGGVDDRREGLGCEPREPPAWSTASAPATTSRSWSRTTVSSRSRCASCAQCELCESFELAPVGPSSVWRDVLAEQKGQSAHTCGAVLNRLSRRVPPAPP